MKYLLTIFTMIFVAASGFGRAITVHEINDETKKPVKDIDLNLRIDCENPHRPKSLQQKTDASGTAVFSSVSLAGEPVCVDLFSITYAYAPRQLDYVFVSPDKADQFKKSLNPIITTLPAEVTFHVVRRSLGQRLHFGD